MSAALIRRAGASLGLLGLFFLLDGCQGLSKSTATHSMQDIDHIVFMVQENRSFDNYFGQLPAYWQATGVPAQQFDGLPTNASNPSFDGTSTVVAYHLATECIQNLSPSWNEGHVDWNRQNPTSGTPTMDGFVFTAAHYAQTAPPDEAPLFDTQGIRAMGYRWFAPAMTRTQPNRLYLFAATSAGHAYQPTAPLSNKTIFDLLEAANISWKIYETDPGSSYIQYFQPFASQHAANVVPVSQYLSDVQNGTLPSVALIEGGYNSGRDEHPIVVQLGLHPYLR